MTPRSPVLNEVEVDLRSVFAACFRALPFLLIFALIVAAGAFFLLRSATPEYSAETTILIQEGESVLTRGDGLAEAATLLDQEGVASQVQLIRSRDLSRAVIEKLDLTEVPEFNPALREPSTLDTVMAAIGLGPAADEPAEERVLAEFVDNLNVYPVDRTRVITVEFVSSDPQLAARVANAVAEEYIAMQREAKRGTTADATEWLEEEIASLGARVKEAEGKVEAFRAESDLFTAGQSNATIAQQQLGELSSELSRVRAERAAAEAKAAQIREGLDNGAALNSVDVLNSALIQRLREQQVALQASIAEASATMLPGHPRLRELRAQLADLDAQIRREAEKVVRTLDEGAALARSREAEIERQVDELKAAAARSNEAEVQLRALEREAAAQRDLLQTYLLRYREAVSRVNRDNLPADARIISRAVAPLEPYFPKVVPMTGAAMVIAFILGFGFVLVRELASGRSLRPAAIDLPVMPVMPVVPDAVPVGARLRWSDEGDVRRMMPHDPRAAAGLADRVEQSLGAIAAEIRKRGARRILITMADGPGREGRPLAAVALARTMARSGARVVLVDLRRDDDADRIAMGEGADLPGFGDLFAGDASFAQVIFRDRSSPAHFIPKGEKPLPADFSEGERLTTLLDALDHTYDHVVYDVDEGGLAVLGAAAGAVILVSEAGPADPRTVRAYEAVKAKTPAEILVLVADPVPASVSNAGAEEGAGTAPEAEAEAERVATEAVAAALRPSRGASSRRAGEAA